MRRSSVKQRGILGLPLLSKDSLQTGGDAAGRTLIFIINNNNNYAHCLMNFFLKATFSFIFVGN